MDFFEDPRVRQRWNQISHDAEAATENAVVGIWSFQHHYVNPCLSSITTSFNQCMGTCFGDVEDHRRRRREREQEAELNFDFYGDWYDEGVGSSHGGGGLLGSWRGEDWDRLLAGTGGSRKHNSVGADNQPKRTRGMNYGTRRRRRRSSAGQDDPTVIPSTQPIGFLSKLPWRLGGTLRYMPSAANLQEHPARHDNAETEPLLGSGSLSDDGKIQVRRKRRGTTGSGGTSDSYRSRGDLFPSDAEGEEDAVPLDDEVTFDLFRRGDRGSVKSSQTHNSKGKKRTIGGPRTVSSQTTITSQTSRESLGSRRQLSGSPPAVSDAEHLHLVEDVLMKEDRMVHAEDEKAAQREVANRQIEPMLDPGVSVSGSAQDSEHKPAMVDTEDDMPEIVNRTGAETPESKISDQDYTENYVATRRGSEVGGCDDFVPARLPFFG